MPLFVLSLTSDLPSRVILVLVSVLAVFGSQLGVELRDPIIVVGSESVNLSGVSVVPIGTVVFVLAR